MLGFPSSPAGAGSACEAVRLCLQVCLCTRVCVCTCVCTHMCRGPCVWLGGGAQAVQQTARLPRIPRQHLVKTRQLLVQAAALALPLPTDMTLGRVCKSSQACFVQKSRMLTPVRVRLQRLGESQNQRGPEGARAVLSLPSCSLGTFH